MWWLMEYRIEPPKGSSEEPIIMEFNSYAEMMHYLEQKNNDIYDRDPATEPLSFRPGTID